MKKFIWILRAAIYMRSRVGGWTWRDLTFAWETGAVLWDSAEEFGDEPGCPREAVDEELSCWGD
ncbi:hypothetical protein ACTUVN_002641 [Pseudomonas caspiana]